MRQLRLIRLRKHMCRIHPPRIVVTSPVEVFFEKPQRLFQYLRIGYETVETRLISVSLILCQWILLTSFLWEMN